MRKTGKSPADATASRLLLHLEPGLRQAVDGDDVYYVEAKADDSEVRLRGSRRLRDVRPLELVAKALKDRGFVRIHRSYLVNVRHVKLVRKRKRGEDWDVVLESPVNAVLPVSRSGLSALWRALGED
jgi:DNA-binding LytR/AlgR family response regulator